MDEKASDERDEGDDEQVGRFCDAFVSDFDGTSALVISALEKETESPTVIIETLSEILRQVEVWLPAETCERFESELVPHVVQVVLSKSEDAMMDSESVGCIADFLDIVLERVAHRLLYCDPCLLPTLMRILDEHRSFYENHWVISSVETTPFVNEDGVRVSALYLRAISHWGTTGGFTLLLRCLQASGARSEGDDDPKPTPECPEVPSEVTKETVFQFEAIQYVFRSIYAVKDHLSIEFLNQFVAPLAQSSRIYVTSITDSEFASLPREKLLEIVHIVEIVVDQASRINGENEDKYASEVAEAELCVQLLHLDLMLRFFTSSSLEKRIYGLVEIIDILNKATALHTSFFLKWIHDNQLVDLLFGEKKHPELIKRALPILRFVLTSGDMPSEWIDAMWLCLGGKRLQVSDPDRDSVTSQGTETQTHEIVRVTVNHLLVEVVGIANPELLEHLLKLIENSSRPLDSDMILVIASLAKRSHPLRKASLTFLWSTLPHASSTVADQAIEEMVACLGGGLDAVEAEEESLTDVFIELCAVSIESAASSLSVSLRLIEKIGNYVKERRVGVKATIAARLIPAALAELDVFEQQFKQISDDIEYAATDADDHVHGVRERLLALRGCMVIAHLSLDEVSTAEVVERVWQLCVQKTNHIDESASLFFQWIEYCFRTKVGSTDAEVRLLDECLAEQLIEKRFGFLDGSAMTMSALACFHHLFRKVNVIRGGIVVCNGEGTEVDEDDAQEDVDPLTLSDLLTGKPIIGIEQLWGFALHACDQAVAEEAMTLLARYHMDVVSSLVGSEFEYGLKRAFVAKCIGHLCSGDPDNHIARPTAVRNGNCDVSHVGRCLDCLRYFLEANQGVAEGGDGESPQPEEHDRSSRLTEGLNRYALDNLEQKLQLLEVFPSPMKESPFTLNQNAEGGAPAMLYSGPRRPSWNFKQHHAILEAIQDENEVETRPAEDANDTDETGEASLMLSGSMRRLDLPSDVPAVERRLSIDTSVPCALRPTQLTTSPAVRARPNLQWFETAHLLSSQEPDFVIRGLETGIDEDQLDGGSTQSPMHVAQLLVNWPQLFDTLLDLVHSSDSGTSRRAWGLLCQLPINAEVLKRMLTLRPSSSEDVRWFELLDGHSPYRLLYSLRLVEALLLSSRSKQPESISEDKVRRQWRERFLRLGGVQHLETVLEGFRSRKEDTRIVLSCVGAIARILAYFARLHYSPPDLIDANSPFDSRLTLSTLSQYFPVSGEGFDELFCLVKGLIHTPAAPREDSSDTTLLRVVDLFCCLVPLNPIRAMASLHEGNSNGIRGLLESLFSTFESSSTHRQVIKSIIGMKDLFVSDAASREFYQAVLKAAFEMNHEGEESRDLLLLIASLSPHVPDIADWMMQRSMVSMILARVHSLALAGSGGTVDSLCSYLHVVAAISSSPGVLQDSCLKFQPRGVEKGDLPWILDFAARTILWNTENTLRPCIDDLATRQAAQRVVMTLGFSTTSRTDGYDMPLLRQLTSLYETVHSRLTTMGRPWNFRPSDEVRDLGPSGTLFAGLVNPGCVCYMNSLMQQLFMMPTFRNGLLTVDVSSSSTEWRNEIAELQKLFVAMSASHRKALDPTEFALSHRDMDGNPTDLNVQMDADEFFCLLLDRVETCVLQSAVSKSMANDHTTFLDQCFGGVLVNQILTEHGHLSEREEKFFALSLDVSQKQHLPESLSLYVEGETLDGDNAYYCEKSKKKVSATKRVCIKKLPRTLVCHLKRFEFDFDTMEKIKIHDYLAFPEEIDMFPYTSEAFSTKLGEDSKQKSIMYDLVGTVVHSGSSDMGHYYSFIKDRGATPGDPSKWYEFNDQTVKPFDVSTMGDECFGGEEVTQKWDQTSRTYVPMVQRKRRSAYMLIYEQRDGNLNRDASLPLDWSDVPVVVQEYREAVLQENQELQHILNVASLDHLKFLTEMVSARLSSSEDETRKRDESGDHGSADSAVDDVGELLSRSEYADLHAAVISCKHIFGVSSLLNEEEDETAIGNLVDSIREWQRHATPSSVDRKLLFCRWLLSQAISGSASSKSGRAFVRRSWMFDVLVFCEKRLPFVQHCCSLLQFSLQFLAKHARTNTDQRAVVDFLRYTSELFYERHEVVIEDPDSGTRFPVPQASIIHASTILGSFLKDCINSDDEGMICSLFLSKSGFIDRFLFSLQDNESPRKSGSSVMAPLTSRVRSSTFILERQLLTDAFSSLSKLREDVMEDSRLLMNHSVLKNAVTFEFAEVLTPLIVYCIQHQMSRGQGEKLVALLLAVLEEVKSTHLDQLLHIFGALLDAKEEADNASGLTSLHDHIFSPSSGLLEAAAYYRDHRTLHEYAFLLVEFVVTRAESSPRLQRYFQNDEEIAGQIEWVKHWLGTYLDPSGAIRRAGGEDCDDGNAPTSPASSATKDQSDAPALEKEVRSIFKKAERAFGFAMLQTQTLASLEEVEHDDKAFAIASLEDSDGLLFSSDGENQDEDDDNDASGDVSSGKGLARLSLHGHRRLSLDTTATRVVAKSDHRGPEVEEESSSSSTIVTRAHMSSAA